MLFPACAFLWGFHFLLEITEAVCYLPFYEEKCFVLSSLADGGCYRQVKYIHTFIYDDKTY